LCIKSFNYIIKVAGEDITMSLDDIFITGGGDLRWNNDTVNIILL